MLQCIRDKCSNLTCWQNYSFIFVADLRWSGWWVSEWVGCRQVGRQTGGRSDGWAGSRQVGRQ